VRKQFIEQQNGQKDLFENLVIKISTAQLEKCNDNLSRVYKSARKLRLKDIVIDTPDLYLNVGYINWVKHKKRNPYMEVEVSKEILPYLVALAEHFTTYSLTVAIALKSVYSQRLYELCSKWKNRGKYFFYSIDELRKMFSIENKYPRFGDLNLNVLKVAQKELKEAYDEGFSDLYFDYKPKDKKGKKILSVEFFIHERKTNIPTHTLDDYINFITSKLKTYYPKNKKYVEIILKTLNDKPGIAEEMANKIIQKEDAYPRSDVPAILKYVFSEDFGIAAKMTVRQKTIDE
jgi:plasmid replication initiation protein